MEESEKIINAKKIAISSLVDSTREINKSLGSFSGWLTAGVGAAFSLLLANYETVSRFVCTSHVRFALLLLVFGLIVSIVARFLSAMCSSTLGSHKASTAMIERFVDTGEKYDLNIFITEFERGLFPYQRWIARRSMAKALSGDVVFGARFMAKLSQVQALLVLGEAVLTIAAATTLVMGLKAL